MSKNFTGHEGAKPSHLARRALLDRELLQAQLRYDAAIKRWNDLK